MKRLMSLAALGVVLACGTAAAQQMNVKIGVLTDMSSLYADATGIGSVIAARMAAADFMKDHPNVKVEVVSGDHQNKAGYRLADCQPVVRRRSCRHDRRRAELGCGARNQPDFQSEEQGLCRLRSCEFGSHRTKMQCKHGALDLRHVDACEWHGQGCREDGRRYLVLPHLRLCFRSCAGARYRGGRAQERRQGAGQGPSSDQHQRLLVVPAAGAGVEGARSSGSPMPAATPSTRSSRRRIRHRKGRTETSPAFWFSRPTSTRSASRPRRALF